MKLGQIDIVERAERVVELKVSGSSKIYPVGLRLLTAGEQSDVYRKAKAAAAERGASEWDQDDPVCALELYVETVAACAYDVDDEERREPFATADELRSNAAIGQENLIHLYEAYLAFADESSIRPEKMGPVELLEFCLGCTKADNHAFLDRLRPGTLRTLLRFLAAQYLNSLRSTSTGTSDTESGTDFS